MKRTHNPVSDTNGVVVTWLSDQLTQWNKTIQMAQENGLTPTVPVMPITLDPDLTQHCYPAGRTPSSYPREYKPLRLLS